MIDIHCHILPGFDDGSSGLEESLTMARLAAESGMTGIVTTPHFRGEESFLKNIPTIARLYDSFARNLLIYGIPLEIYRGAEILCLPETTALAAKKMLPTIADTDYILVEFYFDESRSFMDDTLEQLSDMGYHPVVAHPERYNAVQRDPRLLPKWFRKGYLLQVNKGSLLGAFGSRPQQTAQWAMQSGLVHMIASDAHHADRRTPHMGSLLEWMEEHCSEEYAKILLEENPARLVRGLPMTPIE